MMRIDRRQFIRYSAGAGIAGRFFPGALAAAERKMKMALSCSAIGVSANMPDAIGLAARFGFEAVEVNGPYLASLSTEKIPELQEYAKAKGVAFGAAVLPVEFRRDETRFNEDLKRLPAVALALERAGVDRVTTWVMPCHDSLTYIGNFRQHAARLRRVAQVLGERNIRLGLEYVGPKTLWTSKRYPFVHSMAEMNDLIGEIGGSNVGYLLDSFHWWNAGEAEADILSLDRRQVVSVDLNDAPAGIPRDQQLDNQRELPCATGVIDVGSFLNALNRIGYDGPVRAEPFNKIVNAMPGEEACAVTAKALKQAFALIKSSG